MVDLSLPIIGSALLMIDLSLPTSGRYLLVADLSMPLLNQNVFPARKKNFAHP
jgi:hypothetical protein